MSGRWRQARAAPTIVPVFASLGNALVRWRWLVIAAWAVVGVIAALRAGGTVERLELKGGSAEMTEAKIADSVLVARFDRPLSEFYAVTVQGPGSMTSGEGGQLLDRLLEAAAAQRAVRGTVSWASTGDSTFLARDGRTTFFLVALESNDVALETVAPIRQALDSVLRRFPDRDAYTIRVTGRAPLDLDIRTVSAEDATRNETRLIPISRVPSAVNR